MLASFCAYSLNISSTAGLSFMGEADSVANLDVAVEDLRAGIPSNSNRLVSTIQMVHRAGCCRHNRFVPVLCPVCFFV